MVRFALPLLVPLCVSGATPPAASRSSPEAALVREARRFMDGYARDLRTGDRDAIAARYSRRGAYTLGHWPKRFEAHSAIRATYAGDGWQKPHSFAWEDLSYEPLGSNAIVVTGSLLWGSDPENSPARIAYTGVLQRENGRLAIRLEHENLLRTPAPAAAKQDGPAGIHR